jgi:hypothetical protein
MSLAQSISSSPLPSTATLKKLFVPKVLSEYQAETTQRMAATRTQIDVLPTTMKVNAPIADAAFAGSLMVTVAAAAVLGHQLCKLSPPSTYRDTTQDSRRLSNCKYASLGGLIGGVGIVASSIFSVAPLQTTLLSSVFMIAFGGIFAAASYAEKSAQLQPALARGK